MSLQRGKYSAVSAEPAHGGLIKMVAARMERVKLTLPGNNMNDVSPLQNYVVIYMPLGQTPALIID